MAYDRTPELLKSITDQLAEGISLVKICKQEGMPDYSTIMRWQDADEEFAIECARARALFGDRDVEKLYEINSKVESGTMEPQAASVISSNLKWTASKHAPKKYGDKIQQEHSGAVNVEIVKFGELPKDGKPE